MQYILSQECNIAISFEMLIEAWNLSQLSPTLCIYVYDIYNFSSIYHIWKCRHRLEPRINTNDGSVFIGRSRTNVYEIWIKILRVSVFENVVCKMAAILSWSQCGNHKITTQACCRSNWPFYMHKWVLCLNCWLQSWNIFAINRTLLVGLMILCIYNGIPAFVWWFRIIQWYTQAIFSILLNPCNPVVVVVNFISNRVQHLHGNENRHN